MIDSPPQRSRLTASTAALIILLNLIPVAGVLWMGWDGAQILLLYWAENIVVGLMTLPRIITAQGHSRKPGDSPLAPRSSLAGQTALGCFFTIHYGLFCLVHGVFAWLIAGTLMNVGPGGSSGDPFDGELWAHTFGQSGFLWALAGIAALHLALFIREWVLQSGWRRALPTDEMTRPYGRIIVMHLTILAGAWIIGATRAPIGAVLLLCLIKTAIELWTEASGGLLKARVEGAPDPTARS